MPILNAIIAHEVFRRLIRQGMAPGRVEGLTEGRNEGEPHVVPRQIARRFGPVPDCTERRIGTMQTPGIDRVAIRLPDAASLEELPG